MALGGGSVTKSPYCGSMGTWDWVPEIYIKHHTDMTPQWDWEGNIVNSACSRSSLGEQASKYKRCLSQGIRQGPMPKSALWCPPAHHGMHVPAHMHMNTHIPTHHIYVYTYMQTHIHRDKHTVTKRKGFKPFWGWNN